MRAVFIDVHARSGVAVSVGACPITAIQGGACARGRRGRVQARRDELQDGLRGRIRHEIRPSVSNRLGLVRHAQKDGSVEVVGECGRVRRGREERGIISTPSAH